VRALIFQFAFLFWGSLLHSQVVQGDYIYHFVRRGETLWSIAKAYGISLEEIYEHNPPQIKEKIRENDVIKIPIKKSYYYKKEGVVPEYFVRGDTVFHIVSSKETIYRISRQYDVPMDSIKKWNALGDVIRAGDTIKIIVKKGELPESEPDTLMSYKVKKGDTYYSIAREFGINVDSIIFLNRGIHPHDLKEGMIIRLPMKKEKKIEGTSQSETPLKTETFRVSIDTPLKVFFILSERSGDTLLESDIRKIGIAKMLSQSLKLPQKSEIHIIPLRGITGAERGIFVVDASDFNALQLNAAIKSMENIYFVRGDVKVSSNNKGIIILPSEEWVYYDTLLKFLCENFKGARHIIVEAGKKPPDFVIQKYEGCISEKINYFFGNEKMVAEGLRRGKTNIVVMIATDEYIEFLTGYFGRKVKDDSIDIKVFLPWEQLVHARPEYLMMGEVWGFGDNTIMFGTQFNNEIFASPHSFAQKFVEETGLMPSSMDYITYEIVKALMGHISYIIGHGKSLELDSIFNGVVNLVKENGINIKRWGDSNYIWKWQWVKIAPVKKVVYDIQKDK